jgi:hypothetical protein
MPPRVPGRCFVCGKDGMLKNLLCEDCAARLAPPRREPVWEPTPDRRIECHPSSADLMIAAGYRLVRSKIDPDTGIVTSQVWANSTDEGS